MGTRRYRPRFVTTCLAAAAMTFAATCVSGCFWNSDAQTPVNTGTSDTIVASLRAAPRSFNRYVARDLATTVVTALTHAGLVRINRATDEVEPELAMRWQLLPDRRSYRVWLRRDIRFSDGTAFSAQDVEFSFRAVYDPKVESVLADSLLVNGKPLIVRAEDTQTVVISFPEPFAPGLRILDGVPILPRHRLEAALAAGTFQSAWSTQIAPGELVGLGPFVLREHNRERLRFDRNPHYWHQSEIQRDSLEHVVLEVVSSQDAEAIRLQTGSIDFTQSEIQPVDLAGSRRAAERGLLTVQEVGTALDGDLFWLNLKGPASQRDERPWLRQRAFRRAIAHAVDRAAFVKTVYLGDAVAADGVVSPGNRNWYLDTPGPQHDVEAAKDLLISLQLVDRDGDGLREDAARQPVRFTLLTQAGNTSLERGAFMLRESLATLGVTADVVPLEVSALIQRLTSGDYEAAYFRLLTTDTDPVLNQEFWLSSGSVHVWNPLQKTPATPWEAEIDALMKRLASSQDAADRRQLFAQVQQIMAREVPAISFAFPRMWIAFNRRIEGATPAAFRPPILWNPASLRLSSRTRQDSSSRLSLNVQ